MIPRPFAVIGFSAFFTLSLLYNLNFEAATAAAAVLAAAFVVSLAVRPLRRERVIPVSLASCLVASALFAGALALEYKPALEYAGKTCDIVCELTDGGKKEYGRYRYEARVLSVDGRKADMKVRLCFPSPPEAEPYDILGGSFTIYELGASDEGVNSSFRASRVFIGAYSEGDFAVKNVPAEEKPFAYKLHIARESIKSTVYRFLPDESGALIIALLIGDKSGISNETLAEFRAVGISHIICVSGLHLSIWAMFLFKLAKKLRLGVKAASAVSGIIVLGYMALTGFSYSVVRAGIMCLVFLAGNLLSREKDSLNSLGFAVTVISLINPFAAGDLSLRLSFLSTLGIICGYSAVGPHINAFFKKLRSGPPLKVLRYAVLTVFTTLCAVSFTLPAMLEQQTEINLVCFASNLLTIFASTACMVISGAAVIFSYLPVAGVPAMWAAKAGGLLSRYVIYAANRLSGVDAFKFYYDEHLAKLWLAGAFIVAALAVLLALRGESRFRLASGLVCATFMVMLGASLSFSSSTARITVTDVGNGTAVIVGRGGDGILLGCGGDTFSAANDITRAMESSGISNLRLMLLPRVNETDSACAVGVLDSFVPEAAAFNALPWGAELLLNKSLSIGAAFGRSEVLPGVFVKSVVNESSCYAVIEIDNSKILISFYPGGCIPEKDRLADILICRSDVPEGLDLSAFDLIALSGEAKALTVQNELLCRSLPAAATAGDGNIVLLTQGDGVFKALREN